MSQNPLAALSHRVRYWLTPILEHCPDALFRERPRSVQTYVVGMPRSGTVSLYDVFKTHFRSAHEPESRFLTRRIVAWRQGRLSETALRAYLRKRDRRLNLELDTSYLNGEIVALLASEFPASRYILTLRDALGWTDSLLNFLRNKPEFLHAARKPHIRAHMESVFGPPPYRYAPEEKVLQEHGLHPLRCYLAYWNEHNSRIVDNVPAERLLVIKTRDIGRSTEQITDFLGLPAGSLQPAVHSNAAPVRHSLLDAIDPAFVRRQVEEHCGPLMRRYFPELMETA